jgi:hypothetical protein
MTIAPPASTVNTNVPPQNYDGVPPKQEQVAKFNEALNRPTTSNDASGTQSSKGTDQSQGASNSYYFPIATSPPLNLAKPAQPYAGETPKGPPSQADAAPKDDKKAPADTTQTDKKADANTTQTETGTSTSQPKDAVVDGKKAADDDDKPHFETNGQALVTGNLSKDKKAFASLDASVNLVAKNTNLGPVFKIDSRNVVSTLHEPYVSGGASLQHQNPDDATTPGGRGPGLSAHVQGQVGGDVVNYTNKNAEGKDSVEVALGATLGVDLYAGKHEVQGSVQLGVEKHVTDKVSGIIQATLPISAHPLPSVGIGVKVTF